ncbi:hypothetical protein BDN72DRAFT_960706 [Pluteus cervinus]|uniref:Uncharacterized protein n=1 Tax=Pluteus cervinus TaxID=181527 RepID=A0ACD3APS8_9AGAR|nr:hypothetical protein BDN72DRAFT_960706 [Pluteus cervinus]
MSEKPFPFLSSIHDLPNDLILQIFQLLQGDILAIARVSRYLNSLVTSYYFPGRSNPHHLDSITFHSNESHTAIHPKCTTRVERAIPSTDPLAFLSIAFDIHSLGELAWEFVGIDRPNPSQSLVNQYRRLSLLLSRLQSVDKVSLNFTGRKTERPHRVKVPPTLDKWTVAMVDLMNACVGALKANSKGAEELSMTGGLPIMGYRLDYTGSGPAFMVGEHPTLHGPGWKILRLGNKPLSDADTGILISPEARSVAETTKKFTIATTAFLHPPLCEWAYQFLSCAPLTSLTLGPLCYDATYWTSMLTWLPIPLQHLEEFTIRGCENIPGVSLAKFVQDLPSLKHCHIDVQADYHIKDFDITPLSLPNLVTLIAPPNFLYITRPDPSKPPKWFRVLNRIRGITTPRLSTLRIVVPRSYIDRRTDEVLKAYSNAPSVVVDLKGPLFLYLALTLSSGLDTSGKRSKVPSSYTSVKEIVVLADVMYWVVNVQGFEQRFLDFLGAFKNVKVLRVAFRALPPPQSQAPDNYPWTQPRMLDLYKRTCKSLELIVEGIDGKIVLHDFR